MQSVSRHGARARVQTDDGFANLVYLRLQRGVGVVRDVPQALQALRGLRRAPLRFGEHRARLHDGGRGGARLEPRRFVIVERRLKLVASLDALLRLFVARVDDAARSFEVGAPFFPLGARGG